MAFRARDVKLFSHPFVMKIQLGSLHDFVHMFVLIACKFKIQSTCHASQIETVCLLNDEFTLRFHCR
jgi:hypothetical protein